ncbi:hypothetical protein ES703_75066 [subsurface metagenome]
MADFRERAVAAVDGDNRLRGFNHRHIPGVAEAGNDGYFNVRIGGQTVIPGEYADGQPSLVAGALTGSFHDAPQTPADQYGSLPGNFTAHFFGDAGYL